MPKLNCKHFFISKILLIKAQYYQNFTPTFFHDFFKKNSKNYLYKLIHLRKLFAYKKREMQYMNTSKTMISKKINSKIYTIKAPYTIYDYHNCTANIFHIEDFTYQSSIFNIPYFLN